MEDLIHYSYKPLCLESLIDYTNRLKWGFSKRKIKSKPVGLWYAVGDAWRYFCESSNWKLDHFCNGYKYIITTDREVIKKVTISQINEFSEQYNYDVSDRERMGYCFDLINWPKLAEEGFFGIELASYDYNRNLVPIGSWAISWDVPSGCVWNPKAIKDIKLA